MKSFLKVAFVLAAVIALGIGAVLYFSAGMVEAADGFFAAVARNDLAAARGYLSEDFKATTDEAALKRFLETSAVSRFKSASWSNRQISGGRGELEGTVTTESGGSVPLKLTLVKENGAWKIYGIRKAPAGLQGEAAASYVPSAGDQVALIRRSIADFAVSVQARSMEHFRETLSNLWQKQTTAAQLDEIFGKTYGADLDFSALDAVEPVLEPVANLDENGVLVLKGYFPTHPDQFHFQHKYIQEGTGWKLVGFSFNIKQPGE